MSTGSRARQSEGQDRLKSIPDSAQYHNVDRLEGVQAGDAQVESSLMLAALQRLRQERRLRWEPDEGEQDGVRDHFIRRPREEDAGETQSMHFFPLQERMAWAPRASTASRRTARWEEHLEEAVTYGGGPQEDDGLSAVKEKRMGSKMMSKW